MSVQPRYSAPGFIALFLCGGFFLFWFIERFSGISVWDDAYLYTRYADNFLNHGDFAWNPGEAPTWGLTSQFYAIPIVMLRFVFGNASVSLILYSCSLFFGLTFLYFLTKTLLNKGKNAVEKQFIVFFLFVIIAFNAPQLNYHFSSGMDTSFVLAWEAILLFLLLRWEQFLSPSRAMMIGLWAGLAYFIRPDLLAIALPPVLFLPIFARRKMARTQGRYIAAFFFFALTAQALLAMRVYGDLLPLPFYVKSLNPYGEAFLENYRFQGPTDLGSFLLTNFLSLILIGVAFFKYPAKWWKAHSIAELSLLLGASAFMLYYAVFVTHIMSFSQRFYYPLLPIFAFLGGKSLILLIRENGEIVLRLLKIRAFRAWALVLVLSFGLIMRGAIKGRPADLSYRIANFHTEAAYQYVGLNIWPMLDNLRQFPDNFSISTTELGIPGTLLPDKIIYDLAGLNNPRTATSFDPDSFFVYAKPDWIYLPHPHYVEMNAKLRSNLFFLENYEVYDEATLKCYQGVAIWRKSPYFEQMKGIIQSYLTHIHG